MMTEDEKWMRRCIELARQGVQGAPPNPMVGAVIVCEGKIIGEGYHVHCGEGHAEVNAFASVRHPELLERSTLYVSLEPCAHYGRTPPCAELIVRKKVKRVVVGCIDPFAKVRGRGVRMLREAGIEVTTGVLERDCEALNRKFMTCQTLHRPFVTLKWAQSRDGFMAPAAPAGRSVFISTPHTQIWTHHLRAEREAILIGRRTAETDNPSLNVRHWAGRNPLRIVLDRNATLKKNLHLFDGSTPTLIVGEKRPDMKLGDSGIDFLKADYGHSIWPQIFAELNRREIQSVLVEGGAEVLKSLIKENLWDEAYIEIGSGNFGAGLAAPSLPCGCLMEARPLWNHLLLHYTNKGAAVDEQGF